MPNVRKVKRELEKRLKALDAKFDQIEDDLHVAHDPDWAEQATERAGEEVLEALKNSVLMEATKVRAALQRIANGTYGECVTCGEEIDEKRLKAVPYATKCIKCMQVASA